MTEEESEISTETFVVSRCSYLMPLMDMAVKFHSWIPFFSSHEKGELFSRNFQLFCNRKEV